MRPFDSAGAGAGAADDSAAWLSDRGVGYGSGSGASRGRVGRDLLAGLADPGDRLADRRLALGSAIFSRTPAKVRLDLLRHLVRVDLEERLALRDLVALALQPLRTIPDSIP